MSDCDRLWEVDAYREARLGEKDAESFERHLRACRECRTRHASDERLQTLGRSLPEDGPTDLTLRRLRARVLRDAATGATVREGMPRAHLLTAAALAIAILSGGVWALLGRSTPHESARPASSVATPLVAAVATELPPSLAGIVTATAGARWTQVREGGVERVVLDEGTVAIHVRHQLSGERFLVIVPDGEIEVRGTTFDVTVAHGVTVRVHVDEGIVDVRLRGRPEARLGRGEIWPMPLAAPSTGPVAQPTKNTAPRASTSASSELSDEGASAYADAVGLLRDGHADEAATAFHAFLLAHPGQPQTEDASFLEAVALARAGRSEAAALVAEHHLAAYPGSFHRKEAAILVARAASQRADCNRARAVLAPWIPSNDADTRDALGTCSSGP